MGYAEELAGASRTPQSILAIGLPRCENFYATLVKQLLQYTEDFSNAAWTKSGATVLTDDPISVAPDGVSVTADRITWSAVNDYVEQIATGFAAASGTFVFSVFHAIRGSGGDIKIEIRDSTGSEIFNATFTNTTSWTRYDVTAQFSGAATGDVRVRIYKVTNSAAVGDLFWGANLTKNPSNNGQRALFPYVKRVNEADTVLAVNASRCQAADAGDGSRCFYS